LNKERWWIYMEIYLEIYMERWWIYMEMKRAQCCCDRLEPVWLENGFQTELGTFKIEVGEIIMETSL